MRALPVQARLTGLDDDDDDEIAVDPRYGIEAAVEPGQGDSVSRRATGEGA